MSGFARRPPAVVCPICGRQYGTASIEIHLKSCRAKFEADEARKPASQRRAVPNVDLTAVKGMSAAQLEAHNAAAFEHWNEKMLSQCGNCGRSFLPDRLAIHQRSCTADNPARRVGEVRSAGPGGSSFVPGSAYGGEYQVPEEALPSALRSGSPPVGRRGSGAATMAMAGGGMGASPSPARPGTAPGSGAGGAGRSTSAGPSRIPRSPVPAAAPPSASGAAASASRRSPAASRAAVAAATGIATGGGGSRPGSSGGVRAGSGVTREADWQGDIRNSLRGLQERLQALQEAVMEELTSIAGEVGVLAAALEAGPGGYDGYEDEEEENKAAE